MAFVGEQLGLLEGDWLGAVETNPGAMSANIGGSGAVSGAIRGDAAAAIAPSGVGKKKPRRIHPRYIYEEEQEEKKLAAFIEKVLEPAPKIKPLEFSAAWIEKQSGIEDAMAAANRAEADYRRAREIEDEDEWLLLML